jgi:hypothetical protein
MGEMQKLEPPMFRFTIRELVLLTLVVAIGVAWWIDHSHAANCREAVIAHADRIRTVLIDARNAYEACAQEFFQGRRSFLPQQPDWAIADKSLDELAAIQGRR